MLCGEDIKEGNFVFSCDSCPCINLENVPLRNFWVEVFGIFLKYYRKYVKYDRKIGRRLRLISQPKYRKQKYVKKPYTPPFRQIRIVRENEFAPRLTQLAFVPVRRLIATRDSLRGRVSLDIYERFNRYIRRGMYSMYARLANALPPVIITPTKPWNEEEWKEHLTIIDKLKQPKPTPKQPTLERKTKSLSALKERIDVLAKPKPVAPSHYRVVVIKESTKNYVATPRILELAVHPHKEEGHYREPKIPKGALTYKITERVQRLATPKEKKVGLIDAKENPFAIAPNALKYKITERVKKLAEPKEYDIPEAKDPLKINPAALKYKATPKILALAKPKGS